MDKQLAYMDKVNNLIKEFSLALNAYLIRYSVEHQEIEIVFTGEHNHYTSTYKFHSVTHLEEFLREL